MALELRSSSYRDGQEIPAKHTCQGADISPALAWSKIPSGTRSLALVVDDPDAPDPAAPQRVWVHWVIYDLPASATSIGEGATGLPPGARTGKNDWGKVGWGGPCPPKGRHRYFHKLYALDVVLGDLGEPTKAQLEAAMKGHVLGESQLVATYQKK
jgi:Raf kinase inhibitor-like YbhB/YbcL family protein